MEHLRNRLKHLMLLLLDVLDEREHAHSVTMDDLSDLLGRSGVSDKDLEDLLSWLRNRGPANTSGEVWLSARQCNCASDGALRVMGPREDELLTPAAFGYLLGLVRTGQIAAEQMESMIQFAQLVPDGPLERSDLPPLLDRVVFQDGLDERLAGVLDGGRTH